MPRKARKTPDPTPTPPTRCAAPTGGTMRLNADPETDPQAATRVHILAVAATVHANGIAARIGKRLIGVDLAQSSNTHTENVFARMAPRDPAEEMLVAQLLATHTRAMHLSDLAAAQTQVDTIRTLNEYADRASNTYRRLMLALTEYRRPPKGGDTHIRQANIAAQQVLLNSEGGRNESATNEQGYWTDGASGTVLAPPSPVRA